MNTRQHLRALSSALAAASFLGLYCQHASALSLQLISAHKGGATLMMDGEKLEAKIGRFTNEGFLLERVKTDAVDFHFNGQNYTLPMGETLAVDSQIQGYVSVAIKADQKDKYKTALLVNGGTLNAEVDRNADSIILSSADADRLGLPYKDKPSHTYKIPVPPKETKEEKELRLAQLAREQKAYAKDPKLPQPGTYKTYLLPLNSIKIGPVEVYGLNAIITEDPAFSQNVLGRDFLKRIFPIWNNHTLTLVRK